MQIVHEGEVSSLLFRWVLGLVSAGAGVLITKLWELQSEKRRERQEIVAKYLSQLQDAVDTLWSRMEGIRNSPSSYDFEGTYFQDTNVYAMGRVLAIERVIAERGLYSIIHTHDKKLSEFLQRRRLSRLLSGNKCHRFERITLAEILIEHKDGVSAIMGPDRFREICKQRKEIGAPLPASIWKLMPNLIEHKEKLDKLLSKLQELSIHLETITHVESVIHSREREDNEFQGGLT
jgi:hypothetical protein